MDTISLKKHIYEENKIEYVLENINCGHIKYHPLKGYYSCSNHNGDNPTAINVKNNEYLNVVNYTRQNEFPENSDIITLVQYNKQCSFIDAVKYLHSLLGIEYNYKKKPEKKEEKFNLLAIFEDIRSKSKLSTIDVGEIQFLDEDILDEYVPLLHIDWYRDGITEKTRKKFKLAYSYKYKRIIIPHFYWLTDELVGMNMRTTVENWRELGITKYLLTNGYDKSKNVYGYCEHHEDIEKLKYVTIFEAEKSVLKRDSLMDFSGLALSGKSLSDEQLRIILSLNVNEVIIAFDKDVSQEEVWYTCEKFYHIRNVSYIWDSWDLLGEKDSPADARMKVYDFLFKYRVKYDEEKHQQYLKSLEKK